jgi:nicotinate-nucleotide pyrophosphorylase (carboxylating)
MNSPHPIFFDEIIINALKEDFGRSGDLTTEALVSKDVRATGRIFAKQSGCIAGLEIAVRTFNLLESGAQIEILAAEGESVKSGDVLSVISASARTILAGERTALNILGRLSGIATSTQEVVKRVKGYKARIVCTRKTTPGLRALEKYAVRTGGGFNHRFGLDDAVLIKENHITVAGSVANAVRGVRSRIGHLAKVEVEVETLEQLRDAVMEKVDIVMLDNMSFETACEAMKIVDGRLMVEVSGGLTSEDAEKYAAIGVDIISMGRLTHSSPAFDVSLIMDPLNGRG